MSHAIDWLWIFVSDKRVDEEMLAKDTDEDFPGGFFPRVMGEKIETVDF